MLDFLEIYSLNIHWIYFKTLNLNIFIFVFLKTYKTLLKF